MSGVRGYKSPLPYEETRIGAAAVYCSDGRIGEHIDDFLHKGLNLPRYDRLACPGGPACMAGRVDAWWEGVALEKQLRFLSTVHQLEHLILIAHQSCAFYVQHLSVQPHRVEQEQLGDLARAVEAALRIKSDLAVHTFFSRMTGASIRFELVSSTSK
jgi:hypothetical protein